MAAVGVLLAGWQVREMNTGRRHDLGNRYIERFWSIDDEMIRAGGACSPEAAVARKRYLRLCEDEFEVAVLDWFDARQWQVWHSAIAGDRARETLSLGLKESDEEYEHVRLCVDSSPGHAISSCLAVAPSR